MHKKQGSTIEMHNGIQMVKTDQLGEVAQLDGVDDWIDIKRVTDPCVVRLCDVGLSVGFWLKFEEGDSILRMGGYTGENVLVLLCRRKDQEFTVISINEINFLLIFEFT